MVDGNLMKMAMLTGMHDGLYYCEDEDGLYPYGMCIQIKKD